MNYDTAFLGKKEIRISPPCLITTHLLPGVKVGDGFISIEYWQKKDNRQYYRYHIDLGSYEYTATDISTGCHHSLQQGLSTILTFLSAAAESYRYAGSKGENSEIFPLPVVQWAADHADEISLAASELEEGEGIIQE
jgi:hypothetical protein